MDKVLVTKAIRPNYNTLGGGPVMVVGGNQGRGSRGRTGLERLGRGIGGLVGVTGALTGQHRSLGSLANAMVSGGAQGSAILGGLGRAASGRTGRARANLREQAKQAQAQREAELAEKYRNEGRGFGIGARNRRRAFENQERLNRINEADRQRVAVMNAQSRDFNRSAKRVQRARDREVGREVGQRDKENMEVGSRMRDLYEQYNRSPQDIRADARTVGNMQPVDSQEQPVDAQNRPVPQTLVLPPPSSQASMDSAGGEIVGDEKRSDNFNNNKGLDNMREPTIQDIMNRKKEEIKEEEQPDPSPSQVAVVSPNPSPSLNDIMNQGGSSKVQGA